MHTRVSALAFLVGALAVSASAQEYGIYRPYFEVKVRSGQMGLSGGETTYNRRYDWSTSNAKSHEADATVFFTALFALEWSLATSSHDTVLIPKNRAFGSSDLGRFELRSESFVLQLHYPTENRIKPYFGVGANRMRVANIVHLRKPPFGYFDFTGSGDNWGLVAQAGVDFVMRWNLVINVDVKQVWNHAVLARRDIQVPQRPIVRYFDYATNPTVIALGVGLRW